VIVVNDGSHDSEELERALEPYLNRIIYIKQPNRGPGSARNAGILRARGRYVALLDADDVWLPDYLKEQLKALTANPRLDLIYADALLFGAGSIAEQTFMQTCPSRGPVTLDALLGQQCAVITACVVVRREALFQAGLFDENYYRSEDFDLWVRLAHGGARMTYQRQVLARHRLRADSLAGDQRRMHECAMEVYANLARKLTLTPHQHKLIEVQIAKYQFSLALATGKRALAAGDFAEAAHALNGARAAQSSAGLSGLKLRLALLALSVAPRLAQRLYLKHREPAPPRSVFAREANRDARITL
jgi:GT2 family glycosyltransferase